MMGIYGAYMVIGCVLLATPIILTQKANHVWSFDKAGSIDNIQDDVTKTKADTRNNKGSGAHFTTFTSSAGKDYLTLSGRNLKINLGTYPDCLSNITNCKNGFTLSLWLRLRSITQSQILLSSSANNRSDESKGITLGMKGGYLYFLVASQGNLHSFSYKAEGNKWVLHTFVWDGSAAKVYVNGKIVSSTYKAKVTSQSKMKTQFNIGGDNTVNDADYDEVTVWHRQLSSLEIKRYYLSYSEKLLLSPKCFSTTTSVCFTANNRKDYYKLIESERIYYMDLRSNVIRQENNGLTDKQKCIDGLESVVNYEIYVETKFIDGRKEASNRLKCQTKDGVPMPPTSLKLKVESSTSLSVSWKKPSPTNGLITHFMLDLYQLSPLKSSKSKRLEVSRSKITFNGLQPGTKYRVNIASVSKVGKGRVASAAAVLYKEEMVSNIRVTGKTSNMINVVWDRGSGSNVYTPKTHRVYYKPLDAAMRHVETNDSSVDVSNLSPLTLYSINVFANVRGSYVKLLKSDLVVKTNGKNECINIGDNRCDPLANCTDTEKGYICTCPVGFAGDGEVCHRIPSYALKTHFCPSEKLRNLEWPRLYGGNVAKLPCPDGVYGHATRRCIAPTLYSPAKYAAPDLSRCVTKEVRELETPIFQMLDDTTTILKVCDEIISVIKSIELYGGDIMAVVSYARQMIMKKFPVSDKSGVKDIGKKFTLFTSILLSNKAVAAWNDIPEISRSNTAKALLAVMENAAVQIINIIEIIDEYTFTAAENNTVIKIQKTASNAVLETFGVNNTLGYAIQIPEDDPALSGSLTNRQEILFFTRYNNIGTYLNKPAGNISVSPAIISATVVGKKMSFTKPVVIRVPHPKGFTVSNPSCSFWDESAKNGGGAWSSNGCELHNTTSKYTFCYCYHLTNFAVLMTLSPIGILKITTGAVAYSLQIITYVGLIVSIVALSIALLSFLCFRFLRSKRIICHSHLVLALLLASITFLFGIESTGNKNVCQAVAVLLEYFYLVAFFWMAVEGLLLYVMLRKMFKEVLLFKKRAFHFTIWVLPAIYVMVMYAIFPQHYGTSQFCWLSTAGGFIWTFILPVLLVILFNTCMMFMALCTMRNRNNEKEESTSNKIWYWMKGTFILICILGVTWVFGLLHLNSDTIIFAYVFAVLNAFQGLFIFIFHCLIDEKVRNEYKRILKCQPRSEYNEKNNSTASSRYHKISTSVTGTPNTGTLRHMSSQSSQKEFETVEEQPDTVFENDEEAGYTKASLPDLKRVSEISEEMVQRDSAIMVESVEHRDSIPEEFVYEEIGRKKGKKKGRAPSDSVPANSVEELMQMFGDDGSKDAVVEVPEEEACMQLNGEARQSLVCEQVMLPDVHASPWRDSMFDRMDNQDKDSRRESAELRDFSREMSENKGDVLMDIYESDDDVMKEICISEQYASNEDMDDKIEQMLGLADSLVSDSENDEPLYRSRDRLSVDRVSVGSQTELFMDDIPLPSPVPPPSPRFNIKISFAPASDDSSDDDTHLPVLDIEEIDKQIEEAKSEEVEDVVPPVTVAMDVESEALVLDEPVPCFEEVFEAEAETPVEAEIEIPDIPEIPEIPEMGEPSDKTETEKPDVNDANIPENRTELKGDDTGEAADRVTTLRDSPDLNKDEPPPPNNRMSIPSSIMHDIGEVVATIPPKMEEREPSQRKRVKSKFRAKPKPLSLSSSFDSNNSKSSNSDTEKDPDPLFLVTAKAELATSPIEPADLELFKEVEDTIEKDREEASNRTKLSRTQSDSPSPTSSVSSSGRSSESPKFRSGMEILQVEENSPVKSKPGRAVIGSPTHTVLEESPSENDAHV